MFEFQTLWTTGRMAIGYLEPIAPRYLWRPIAMLDRVLCRFNSAQSRNEDGSRP